MSSLADFIDELASDGAKDSQGNFSVDVARAREKLNIFRLGSPGFYVLPLISAALASGATVIDLQGSFSDLVMDFDGAHFTARELEDSLSAGDGRLGELGIGLSASLALEPSRVMVSSTHENRVAILEIRDQRAVARSLEVDWRNRLPRGNRLEVVGGNLKEPGLRALLRERCPHQPAVCFQGKRVCIPDCYSSPAMLSISAPGIAEPCAPVSAWVVKRLQRQDVAAKVWLTRHTERSLFHFVVRGITYTEQVDTGAYPGLHAVVASPRVGLDISRSGMVRNREFDSLVKELVNDLDQHLMAHLGRNFRGMLATHRTAARPYLEQWLMGTDSPHGELVRTVLSRVKA